MAAYHGTVELAAGITPKNNGTFALVGAHDVQVDDDGNRLDTELTDLKGKLNWNFDTVDLIVGFENWRFSSSRLSIAEDENSLALYFPVEQGKEYTIVKPQLTSQWRVAYCTTLPAVGTNLTNYHSSAVPSTDLYYTYAAPVNGYLVACICISDADSIQEDVRRNAYAYEGSYSTNITKYTVNLVNVENVPENTGEQLEDLYSKRNGVYYNIMGPDKDVYYDCYIPKNATITMSLASGVAITESDNRARLFFYDSTKTYIGSLWLPVNVTYRTATLAYDRDAYYIMYTCAINDILQVEISGSPSSYRPFVGSVPYNYVNGKKLESETKNTFKKFSDSGYVCLYPEDFELGSISSGEETSNDKRIRTTDYIVANRSTLNFIHDGFFDVTAIAYTDEKVYASIHNIDYFNESDVLKIADCSYIRLVLRKHENPTSNITNDEIQDHARIFIHRINSSGSVCKINVMSNNVGHYNYGTGNGGYYGEDSDDKIAVWRDMYNQTKPDIIVMQEYYDYFDNACNRSSLTNLYNPILPFNKYNIFSSTYGMAIVSKYYLHDMDTFSITTTVDGDETTRHFISAVAEINGYDVLIVDVHLTPGIGATKAAHRLLQADELISRIEEQGYDKVLICGDFNSTYADSSTTPVSYKVQTELLDKFVNAGYTLVNNGYFGSVTTVIHETAGSISIDNIIIKGFVLSGVESKPDWICTSDHYPLLGYITLR